MSIGRKGPQALEDGALRGVTGGAGATGPIGPGGPTEDTPPDHGQGGEGTPPDPDGGGAEGAPGPEGAGDSITWHRWTPAEGPQTIIGGEGEDTLLLGDTGLTLQQILGAIRFDAVAVGQPRPQAVIEGNGIDLGGYSGTLTIGGVEIRFEEIERIQL
jgi:hypothetical protein